MGGEGIKKTYKGRFFTLTAEMSRGGGGRVRGVRGKAKPSFFVLIRVRTHDFVKNLPL